MNNILDYIYWRRDLSFVTNPFNNLDNLVLSELSYVVWDHIVATDFETKVTLEDAIKSFFRESEAYRKTREAYFNYEETFELLIQISQSIRYKDILCCAYQSSTTSDIEQQFAAITFVLPDNSIFVSYRGTDNSVVGWKEDFNMSFRTNVPSQFRAKDYLHNAMVYFSENQFRVGGHSKGGNLAVYASAYVPSVLQKRISTVYNNDGPGFMKSVLNEENFKRLKGKILTFVPQSSIFGLLLYHDEDFQIVNASGSAFVQHKMYNWEVKVDDFVYIEHLNKSSKILDNSLKDWMNQLPLEKKQKFIDTLYQLIIDSGIDNLKDLTGSLKNSYKLIKNYYSLDEETKTFITEGIDHLKKAISSNIFNN